MSGIYSIFETLDRGDINKNIQGGVPTGYEGHHLISVKVAQQYDVMNYAANNLNYDINRGNNGIALPGTKPESLATGLPYHGGRHKRIYDNFLKAKLDRLERDFQAGLLNDNQIEDRITRIEDEMRSDLLNDNIRLQGNDPRP
ncbi:MAG: hypothetical protein HC815_34050 [Richelia sp. RM1_1_1]|nr:hypothetical protein [Richelia sp. RM1_1_1]